MENPARTAETKEDGTLCLWMLSVTIKGHSKAAPVHTDVSDTIGKAGNDTTRPSTV